MKHIKKIYAGYATNGPAAARQIQHTDKAYCFNHDGAVTWYEHKTHVFGDGREVGYWQQQHIVQSPAERFEILLWLAVADLERLGMLLDEASDELAAMVAADNIDAKASKSLADGDLDEGGGEVPAAGMTA